MFVLGVRLRIGLLFHRGYFVTWPYLLNTLQGPAGVACTVGSLPLTDLSIIFSPTPLWYLKSALSVALKRFTRETTFSSRKGHLKSEGREIKGVVWMRNESRSILQFRFQRAVVGYRQDFVAY